MPLFGQQPDIEKLERKKDARKLIKALSHEDPGIRTRAAEALGDLGDPKAVDALIRALDDSDGSVVKVAAIALGRSGDPSAMESLLAHAATSDAIFRHAFVTGGYFHQLEKRGKGGNAAIALRHENQRVRELAARMLAEHGHKEAIPDLMASLDDDDVWVRRTAVKALRTLGADARAVEPLIRRLQNPAEASDIRSEAIAILKDIGDVRAVAPLIEVIVGEAGEEVLLAGIRALAGFRDRSAVAPLVNLLLHESDKVMSAAARALGELGDPSASEPLRRLLKTSRWDAVVWPLERLNRGSPALVALVSFSSLGLDDVGARWKELIESFRADPDVDPIPPLTEALEDDEFARSPVEGASSLFAFVNDQDRKKDFRLWVIEVLGRIGDERAISALENCSRSDPWGQRPDATELTIGRTEWPRREAAAAAIREIRRRTQPQA